ncbi:hypothetical protein PR202_ga28719 [Eleusine coracana subsp. coracana]|uniref:J domain-containing protein n=1 Tax=Eleusine coracana subsp. coracana TaxID=191504 RepID=A0AAV5DKC3_ELECO|nr:hypothetical protein QOZ80_7AG0582580 [Eleusine coracana subsp. coracana]GJN10611.1 hypothetical protein PR202_ga28719 [Eleusine coracana subsp. coracana]
MALLSPSSSPAKRKKKGLRGNKKVIDGYIADARLALSAAQASEDGDDSAAAALGLASAALEMSPRAEAAQEVHARALLLLRRYRDVADLLRDYIPSCKSGDDSTSSFSSSSSSSSGSGVLLSPERSGTCWSLLDVLELKRRLFSSWSWTSSSRRRGSNNAQAGEWRYLVLGQACFHLGLMEDAAALLQTGRRLATAAFRRESVCWSDDSFSPPPPCTNYNNLLDATTNQTQKRGSWSSSSELLAHVKLLLRRRAAAMAALDAGLPTESVRHFTKVLDHARRRGGVLPHPFATACLVGRAAAFRAASRPADAVADCNRALALDPAFIPALRARADLLEGVGAVTECLRDLDHLKLLYDAALRDGKLPGPTWRPQGGVRFAEIAAAHRHLVARIHRLRGRPAAVDYYALLGVPRGCTRAELDRAHLLLTLKLKPDRSTSFAERLELVDEHRDLEAVRDQARMSALFLYRMLQKGYSFIMSAILDHEAAQRQKAKDEAAASMEAESEALNKEEQVTFQAVHIANVVHHQVTNHKPLELEATSTLPPVPSRAPMATSAMTMSPPFQAVFCRDMAVLLSRPGFDRPITVKCEAMTC